jgi:anti-sigma regulatory factor (Ser/Thr protein kinase)
MSGEDAAPDRFSLSVPARPELVETLRLFAAAVARHHGLDDDAVEDVKLAVSEASADAIEAGAGGPLTLAIAGHPSRLELAVTSDAWSTVGRSRRAEDLPEGVDPAALDRMQVVRALFADATRSEEDGRVSVRFSTGTRAG